MGGGGGGVYVDLEASLVAYFWSKSLRKGYSSVKISRELVTLLLHFPSKHHQAGIKPGPRGSLDCGEKHLFGAVGSAQRCFESICWGPRRRGEMSRLTLSQRSGVVTRHDPAAAFSDVPVAAIAIKKGMIRVRTVSVHYRGSPKACALRVDIDPSPPPPPPTPPLRHQR